jgi:hypothetical protein
MGFILTNLLLRGIFVTERARTPFQKFFLRRMKTDGILEPFFLASDTPHPLSDQILGHCAFQNLFFKKNNTAYDSMDIRNLYMVRMVILTNFLVMDPKNIIDANPTTGPLSHINQYRIY